jgi:hypothetical protein
LEHVETNNLAATNQEVEPAAEPATQVNGEAALDLAAKTLSGDLRDQLLELVRDLREPFHKIGESQQEKYVARVSFMVDALIERVVALVAAADFPAIPALLKQATLKDAIEAKVELSRYHESRHLLMDAAGSKVLIVLADADQFHGARGPAKIDKDEPELPVEQVPPAQTELVMPDGIEAP